MRIKKIIKILITAITAIIVIMIIAIIITNIFDKGNTYDDRTKEEYIAILLDNKEDFEYVAKMMQQWPARSFIDFNGGISSNNKEITDAISNNKEFYGHLKNLYDLDEIDYVMIGRTQILFYFSKCPSQCHGCVVYSEEIEGNVNGDKIDDYWTLDMTHYT